MSELSYSQSAGSLDATGAKERSLYQYQAFLNGAPEPRMRRSPSYTHKSKYCKFETFAEIAADWTDLTLRFGPAERRFREVTLERLSDAHKAAEASMRLARDGPTRRRRAEQVRRRKCQISSGQPWRPGRYSGSPAGQQHLGRSCSTDRGVFSTVASLEASESQSRLRHAVADGCASRRVRQLANEVPKLNLDRLPPRPRTAG
eukprot:gnl/MRDRNA2_/MRDRNA2_91513_c0_seq1.p1 gnl/MRDRNA2_/MRDRNA2_91513_c0~~gnl/MRDRNA2_/MRDRNA2_91513_c0_seq1.p1  ORF type:complete len:203 (+),score=29.10 gnl/MRDRNA2_/MRDRNA2_91513_c0_seq1:106-714(+)